MPVNQIRLRQRDNQLLKMLFIYVALNVTCTAPFSVTYVQLHVTLFRLFGLLLNVNFSTSFYAYTLGTPFYQRELKIQTLKSKLRQTNSVHSMRRTTHRTTVI